MFFCEYSSRFSADIQNECRTLSNPCNGGSCYDTQLGFYCSCPRGRSGTRCEKSNPCSVSVSLSYFLKIVDMGSSVIPERGPLIVISSTFPFNSFLFWISFFMRHIIAVLVFVAFSHFKNIQRSTFFNFKQPFMLF